MEVLVGIKKEVIPMDDFMKENELVVGLDCCYRYGKYVKNIWEFEPDYIPYKQFKLTQAIIDEISKWGIPYIEHHNLMIMKEL